MQEQTINKKFINIRRLRAVYGVLVILVAWVISNSSHIPLIHQLLYPKYYQAIKVVEQLEKGIVVDSQVSGFSEFAGILEAKYKVDNIIKIIPLKLTIRQYPSGVTGNDLNFQFIYGNNRPIEIELDCKDAAKRAYLSDDYFGFSLIIFAFGALICLYPVFKTRQRDLVK